MQRQNSPWNTFKDIDLSADVSCRCTLGEKNYLSLLVKNGKYCTEIGSRSSLFIGLGPNELHSQLIAGAEYGPGSERVRNV